MDVANPLEVTDQERERVLASLKRQKQAFRHSPSEGVFGDCYRTCVATLLGVDRDLVPHHAGDLPDGNQTALMRTWLLARGYTLACFAFAADPSEVLHLMQTVNPLTPYMLGGTSKTGTNHVVIALGGEIIWDPSLNDSGIIGRQDDEHTWVEVITPIPGQAMSPLLMSRAA